MSERRKTHLLDFRYIQYVKKYGAQHLCHETRIFEVFNGIMVLLFFSNFSIQSNLFLINF